MHFLKPIVMGAICAWVASAFCFVTSSQASKVSDPRLGFCGKALSHDYREPLHGMPSVRHAPKSGKLPFGPRGLSFYALGSGLRVGQGKIGFAFSDTAIDQPRRLNWLIKSELTRVDSMGRSKGLLASKTSYIGTQKFDQIKTQAFVVTGKPSFYRVDIVIGRRSGAILGRYSEYFRVVRPRFQAQLAISDESAAPGVTVYARVENLGTEPIVPSSRTMVERYDGAIWIEESALSVPGLRSHIRALLPAGRAASCVAYPIPENQPLGLYRVTNSVSRTLSPDTGSQTALSAEFQIGP